MSSFFSDQDFDQQLKTDFLVEAAELMGETEALFLQLEKEPSNVTLIDKIFRIVHTIKGSGAVAGFEGLASFAHIFETLLGRIRTNDLPASQAVVDVLLAGVDVLNQFIRSLRKDHAAIIDPRDTVIRIEAYIGDKFQEPETTMSETNETTATETTGEVELVGSPRKACILLVDDEPSILTTIMEMLRPQGYDVLLASGGNEALSILEKNTGIDLLITDQRMPDMLGSEVIAQLRRRGSDLPAIIVSGASTRDDAIEFVKLGVFDFFEKPFSKEKLLLSVANAIRLGELKSTMTELSKLTIRSYLAFRKLLEVVETETTSVSVSAHPAIQRCSQFLEEIGAVINKARGSDRN